MTTTTRPTKESIREWMDRRTHDQLEPPPDGEEIRRQLGWWLLPSNRRPDRSDRD